MPFPNLNDCEEISTYISEHPANSLGDSEIIEELGHWNTSCRERYWEECRRGIKKDNPLSKVNVIRVGCILLEVLSVPSHIVFPPVGLSLTLAGLSLSIYNEIDAFHERRTKRTREEPIDLVYERCRALEQELEKRGSQ